MPAARTSRTLLATMSVPIPVPDPARGDEAVRTLRLRGAGCAVAAALAAAAGTAVLGVVAGLGWAAAAPRPLLAYLFAVRKHGPLAMTGLLAGALAAAFVARWVGEHFGLATFQHLLATLPVGARLRDSLSLGASGALAFWPLAAGVVAGGLELLGNPGRHRAKRGAGLGE